MKKAITSSATLCAHRPSPVSRAAFRHVVCCDNTEPQPTTAAVVDSLPAARGGRIEGRTVYYVSTPIGNLEDITLRAIRTLKTVDIIASEDTRVTAALLRHLGIGRKTMMSHHDHNLGSSVPKLLQMLEDGASVAVVSDAGTPGISDPGLALALACRSRSIPLVPVPGPCAAVAALSVSAVTAGEFVFMGFLPRGSKARRLKVDEVAHEARTVVLYEAPHRLVDTLGALAAAGARDREVVCARELTKVHEEFHHGTVGTARQWYAGIAERDGKVRNLPTKPWPVTSLHSPD